MVEPEVVEEEVDHYKTSRAYSFSKESTTLMEKSIMKPRNKCKDRKNKCCGGIYSFYLLLLKN